MKVKDIAKAINKKLSDTGIDIVSDDIRSGFDKPAFFVQLTIISSTEASTLITANIHYFPENKTQLELFEMNDLLDEIFGNHVIEVSEEESLYINEIRADYIDNVLQYRFDMNIENDINMFPEEEYVVMEHLELEGV